MLEFTFNKKKSVTDRPALVMGIVNVTPDSFYEKSRGGVQKAFELIEQGADILDIGGESTRPGFEPISVQEEINRIIPVIKEIRKHSQIPISVDTRKMEVFKAAYEYGADILNDVSSLDDDEKMSEFAMSYDFPIILMHRFLEPESTRVTNPNIISQVNDYFLKKITSLKEKGFALQRFIVDPGIGFGKTNQENIILINQLDKLCDGKFPVLMALSRKRVIGYMTGLEVEDRLIGTLAANIVSCQKGAVILRVHDVLPTIQALNVMKYLK